jgi:hypothetical protein
MNVCNPFKIPDNFIVSSGVSIADPIVSIVYRLMRDNYIQKFLDIFFSAFGVDSP